jgi:hypothetical protein
MRHHKLTRTVGNLLNQPHQLLPGKMSLRAGMSELVSDFSTSIGMAPSLHSRPVLRIRPSDPDDPNVPPRFRHSVLHPSSLQEVSIDVDPATLAGQAPGLASGGGKKHTTFTFDHVLPESSTQVDLYDVTASGVIDEYLKGHNVTFLA